jgi:hypothetical protein
MTIRAGEEIHGSGGSGCAWSTSSRSKEEDELPFEGLLQVETT